MRIQCRIKERLIGQDKDKELRIADVGTGERGGKERDYIGL